MAVPTASETRRNCEKIREIVDECGRIGRSALMIKMKGHAKAKALDTAIRRLRREGYMRSEEERTGRPGRPSIYYVKCEVDSEETTAREGES